MIGRTPKTELEGRRDLLYKKLQDLDITRNKVESDIEATVEKIARAERRVMLPKVYYEPLDDYFTAEEMIELDAFFNQKLTDFPSTELTSIC